MFKRPTEFWYIVKLQNCPKKSGLFGYEGGGGLKNRKDLLQQSASIFISLLVWEAPFFT